MAGLMPALIALPLGAAPNPPRINFSGQPIDRNASQPASFAPIVKKVAACVVNIYSSHTIRVTPYGAPFYDDPILQRFFGDGSRRLKTQSLGSGVIITEDGYILTNNHVVEGADDVRVALADGRKEYAAKLVGTDERTDLAILKIDAKGLTPITVTDSDHVEVGDVVLALGNPFGVGQTVTKGIVSAIGRENEDFIQTDAAINPGNSGGALLDIQGRLIGINQSIATRSGGSQGVGFAIPSNLARSIGERLITDGVLKHGYLGVIIQPVTPDLAQEFRLPDELGALVAEVQPGSPAAAAGLKDGDVVRTINGKPVRDSRHLQFIVAQTAPQTKVMLVFIRDGKEQNTSATLGTLPADLGESPKRGETRTGSASKGPMDGVNISDLNPQARQQFDIPENVQGALVTNVERGSLAANAGLRTGEVIVSINRRRMQDARTAAEMIRQARDSRILLRVWSGRGDSGAMRYIVIETGGGQ